MWTLAVQSGSVFNASPDPLTFILNGSKWWCLVGKFSLKCCDGCPFMLICLDLCVFQVKLFTTLCHGVLIASK